MYGRTNAFPQIRNNTVVLWERLYMFRSSLLHYQHVVTTSRVSHSQSRAGRRNRRHGNTKNSNPNITTLYYRMSKDSNIQRYCKRTQTHHSTFTRTQHASAHTHTRGKFNIDIFQHVCLHTALHRRHATHKHRTPEESHRFNPNAATHGHCVHNNKPYTHNPPLLHVHCTTCMYTRFTINLLHLSHTHTHTHTQTRTGTHTGTHTDTPRSLCVCMPHFP